MRDGYARVQAQWELPSSGYGRANHAALIDLAIRLAQLIMPGFQPPADGVILGEENRLGEMGVWLGQRVEVRGKDHGLLLTYDTQDYNDGVTPMWGSLTVEVYGLSRPTILTLWVEDIAPAYRRPNPAGLSATVPPALVEPITAHLTAGYKATISTTNAES